MTRTQISRFLLYTGLGVAVAIPVIAITSRSGLVVAKKALVQPGSKVMLVGDSLAVGLDKYLPALLPGVQYSSRVKGGTAMFQWLGQRSWGTEFISALGQIRPDVVLVCLGTNDSAPASSAIWPQIPQDVDRMIALITSNGAAAYWILPPKLPWDEKVAPVVRTKGIRVFESTQFPIAQTSDGIHATGLGYQFWAGEIAKDLQSAH